MVDNANIPKTTLCRTCASVFELSAEAKLRGCHNCGRSRLVSHSELLDLSIAHVDCDSFYASVEKKEDPTLSNKPLIIGGEHRGVVSTACYIARMSGVRSAMPMYKAKKLCPDAVILRPNMRLYQSVSRDIRAKFEALTPLVEPLSIDEAFLDLSGTQRLHGHSPAAMLAMLANDIEKDIGVTISVGLAPNKFLAKLASDWEKPRGFKVIGEHDMHETLGALPITRIYGIGKKAAEKLRKDGLTEIHQLQSMDEATLMRRYGEIGQRLFRLSRGIDVRSVTSSGKAKSISSERTLERDLANYPELEDKLWSLAENVSADLKRKNMAGITLTLKLKTSMHRIITRSRTLESPTQLAETIFEVGQDLLRPMIDGTPYRLIGMGVSQFRPLTEADQPDLIEPKRTKRANAEKAMDKLKGRYGLHSVHKGRTLKPQGKTAETKKAAKKA
ncbi:DNA polymerase IV [Kordiimonas aquimaris]|uniref:DNA polymerase IV n=1 Tax=Kordiimonas aquimaris TaxID=707591 RepID=UPI0021D0A147|nr:DNA polymerase IV [Kordiimonas aquimaris]